MGLFSQNSPYNDSLNTSSATINSQLVPQVRTNWYNPLAVGPVLQGVPASPPQSPPGYQSGSADGVASNAGATPFSFTQSPVPLLIIMFLAGFLLLRYVHYGY
jgi:hypothetical protein